MQIVVVGLRGAPVGQPTAAQFGPSGGTIGRAAGSTLLLDDPDRTVSRVHAQVLCRGGDYFIVDRGSNPLLYNGQPLGAGNEARLQPGDRLIIGNFDLRVQDVPTQPRTETGIPTGSRPSAKLPDDDPFADLLAGLTPAAPPSAPRPAPAPDPAIGRLPPQALNPMEFAPAKAGAGDPFADLLGPIPGAAPKPHAGIPDDFSDLGLSPSTPSSIDALFDLSVKPSGADPFAQSPLAAPLVQPNTANDADPLAALGQVAKPSAAPHSDHVPALQHAMALPPDTFSDLLGPSPTPQPPAQMGRVEINLASAPVAAPVAELPTQPPKPAVVPAPARAPSPAPTPLPSAAANYAATGSDAELLAAFLRGVGSQHQMPIALTPGLMERVGHMLRSATEGTLQLLLSRQELKREVRAEVTMIGSHHNNPLKFSPTLEVALAHLLGPGVKGFMPAHEAMEDAFNDLRAHQFGVMVGMQAALEHMLKRFTPDQLEQRLAEKSTFESLFAAARKAKLWDQFCLLHAKISEEASEDFHKLFGQAFSEAYEQQMTRFKSDSAGRGEKKPGARLGS